MNTTLYVVSFVYVEKNKYIARLKQNLLNLTSEHNSIMYIYLSFFFFFFLANFHCVNNVWKRERTGKNTAKKVITYRKKIHGKSLSEISVIHGHFQIYVFRPMTFLPWLRENGLLSNSLKCHCCKTCALNKRSKTTGGYSFRCSRCHEFGWESIHFFKDSLMYDIRDLILFIIFFI